MRRPIKNTPSSFHFQRGYTLLEMAVVIIILGLIVAPLLVLYEQYRQKIAFDTTENNVAIVSEAINQYKYSFGTYPCSAPLDAARATPGYGRSTDCNDVSIAVGNCGGDGGAATNAYCVEQSWRPVNDGAGGTIAVQRVRRGAVPFLELGLNEMFAYDGYGNKLTYAVTEQLATGTANFQPLSGGIDVLDANGNNPAVNSVIDPIPSGGPIPNPLAHYIVISHGLDRIGGFNRQGIIVRACPNGLAQTQAENCNLTPNTVGGNLDAVYRSSLISTQGAANQMDDVLAYFTMSDESDPWQESNIEPQNVHTRVAFSEISIGTTDSSSGDSELSGNMKVEDDVATPPNLPPDQADEDTGVEGKIKVTTGNICAGDGSNCITALALAGDNTVFVDLDGDTENDSGMLCGGGTPFMDGISENDPTCTNAFTSGCPTDSYMTGFDPVGRPICSIIPCQPQAVDVCAAGDFTLPLTNPTANVWTDVRGDSRRLRFRCNPGGIWTANQTDDGLDSIRDDGDASDGIEGVCVCIAGASSVPGSCAANFIGNSTVTTTTTCPLGTVTTTTDTSGCVCQPYLDTRTIPCPVGTGFISQERNVACVGNAHVPGGWVNISNTCSCPGTDTVVTPCVSPDVGPGITQTFSVNCVTGDRTLTSTTGSCSCSSGATRTVTAPCPSPQVGTGETYNETFDCTTSTWIRDLTPTSTDCLPPPAGSFEWQPVGPPFLLNQPSCSPGEVDVFTTCADPSDPSSGSPGDTRTCCRSVGSGFHKHTCRCNPD